MGLRPVLKKAQWQGKDFAASSLEVPVGSGPYVVDRVDPGRSISFRRNPDYWGRDLPLTRGMYNFDEIRYDYFADSNAMFQAFKAGAVDVCFGGLRVEGVADFGHDGSEGDHLVEEGAAAEGLLVLFVGGSVERWHSLVEVVWFGRWHVPVCCRDV